MWLRRHVRLQEPEGFGRVDGPMDGVPTAVGVMVLKEESVGVDVEFRGGDDPMGHDVIGVGRCDFLWVGSVVQVQVEVEGAVAA